MFLSMCIDNINCAIVVAYNPNVEQLQSLLNSLDSCDVKSIVVDNSNTPSTLHRCVYLYQGINMGIASAQNIGIKYALDNGFKNVSFFDQDSVIPDENFMSKLHLPILSGQTLITVPIYKNATSGFYYPIVSCNSWGRISKKDPSKCIDNWFTNIYISSGTTVDISVFGSVGLFREDFFIDYVDTEWALRANSHGLQALVVIDALMSHEIGDKTFHFFKKKVPVHSAFRRYYRIRNSFWLFNVKHVPKLLALREVVYSIVHQIILIICLDDKLKYLKSLKNGVFDGFFKGSKNVS